MLDNLARERCISSTLRHHCDDTFYGFIYQQKFDGASEKLTHALKLPLRFDIGADITGRQTFVFLQSPFQFSFSRLYIYRGRSNFWRRQPA